MRRKRLILLVGLGVLAAGVLLCLPRGPKEPVFEGQKLGYWIRKSLNSADPKMEEQAERAVKGAGTNALPYLLDQFTRRPSRWARTLNRVSERYRTSLHAETEDEHITVALLGLSALGPVAAPALPALANELSDPKRGIPAAFVMCQCGDKALPFIRNAIQSTNAEVQVAIAEGLVGSVSAGRFQDAIPELLRLVTNSNQRLARAASNAVQRIDPSALPASPLR